MPQRFVSGAPRLEINAAVKSKNHRPARDQGQNRDNSSPAGERPSVSKVTHVSVQPGSPWWSASVQAAPARPPGRSGTARTASRNKSEQTRVGIQRPWPATAGGIIVIVRNNAPPCA